MKSLQSLFCLLSHCLIFMVVSFLTLLVGCGHKKIMPSDVHVSMVSHSTFKEYRIVSGDILDINFFFDQSEYEYRINAGDRLLVNFPGASSARSEQVVRPDGAITLLSVGDIVVSGKTPQEAAVLISSKVKHILRFPVASVQVLQSRSALEEAVVTGQGSSKKYGVRPDGMITLPALGSVVARGKSIEDLTQEINTRYQVCWPSARVDINLEESQGLQIYVLGEVGTPGLHKITGPAVLPQALSLAGGLTREAASGVVYISRLENDVYVVSKVKISNDFTSLESGAYPLVSPNDIIYIPRSGISEVAQVMQEISNIFMFKGWGFSFSHELVDEN